MRIASYNVHKCVGGDRRFDPARIAAVIAELDADLVAVQEADRRFGVRTGLLDAKALEQAGLRVLPTSALPDGHGWHGNAILLRRDAVVLRGPLRLPLPGLEPRGAVLVEVDLGAGPLRVIAAHLSLLRRCRTRQGEALLQLMGLCNDMPTVILGDFNERRASGSALRVLAPMFGKPAQAASFPARLPLLSLDRILGTPAGLVGPVTVHASPLARMASDHLPLKAEIHFDAAHMTAAPKFFAAA